MSLRDLHKFSISGGDFSDTPFACVLGLARFRQITGTLDVEREKVKKIIYFLNGLPVYCQSDVPGESLRQALFKAGAIDRAKVEEIERAMTADNVEEDRAMLMMGILDDSTRYSHLQALAKKRILSVFQWGSGRYRFIPGEKFLEIIDLFDIDPLDLVHEGVSTYQGANVAHEIQEISYMEVKTVGDLSEIEPFLVRYHPDANMQPLMNGSVKVFQALPSINRDINYALPLMYVLIITGYLSLDGHQPGDNAPDVEEAAADIAEEEGEDKEEEFDHAPELAPPGTTTYRMTKSVKEEVMPRAKSSTHPPAPSAKQTHTPPTPPKAAPKAPVPPPSFRKKVLKAYNGSVPPSQAYKSIRPSIQTQGAQKRPVDQDLLRRFEKMRDMAKGGDYDYYDLLGVTIETDRADIKKQYFQKNQQFHMDRARSLGPEGEIMSQEITNALQNAYQTLLDPSKRHEYETALFKKEQEKAWSMQLRQELSKKQFRRGKWYLTQKSPALAFSFFDSSVKLDPDQAQYYAFLGWAQYASDKSKTGEALAFLKTATGINPRLPEALLFLGWILKETGNEEEALKCFDKAVNADPSNKWAKAELERGNATKQKSEGIFSRLFKK